MPSGGILLLGAMGLGGPGLGFLSVCVTLIRTSEVEHFVHDGIAISFQRLLDGNFLDARLALGRRRR